MFGGLFTPKMVVATASRTLSVPVLCLHALSTCFLTKVLSNSRRLSVCGIRGTSLGPLWLSSSHLCRTSHRNRTAKGSGKPWCLSHSLSGSCSETKHLSHTLLHEPRVGNMVRSTLVLRLEVEQPRPTPIQPSSAYGQEGPDRILICISFILGLHTRTPRHTAVA